MGNSIKYLLLLLVFCNACGQNNKDTGIESPETQKIKPQLVVSDLEIPWGMAFLPDGGILITEKKGQLYRIKGTKKTIIGNTPEVFFSGQGGLLDVALHPNFSENQFIYLTYASSEGGGDGGHTALMRARLQGDQLTENQVLYKGTPNTEKGHHFGSRIAFDRDGYLYFTIGDRGNRDENPQNITRDGGKVYRLHDDGSIPSDNPFVNASGAKTAIYSYGHRNPQGMALHPKTGAIWTHEHGPKGGDEINIIKKGENYGWPVISYGINYDGTSFTDITEKEGMLQPLHYWVPSIAPSGLAIVSSDKYPDWQGDLLVGSLSFQYLEHLVMDGEKVVKREKLMEDIGRVRDVVQAPDGYIYVAVESKGIYRLDPM
ncbi:PQQ-dependent sugar dehydrogenase [Sediminicola luteus]|uniref:Glucose/Sorbosone dehydrogenase domain-containing protein n=1 Tax=Sediminicola luteus TaxID=319238 RepID=A0A2A4G870_9FLAO|nr:PQQ-dependent sugar dehydrogenase [Sediminicola luteus]PCE64817.1 hypothetical protein B7P33_06510 [Sediminicola luteus]